MIEPTRRVLVVDDEPDLQELIAYEFKERGFETGTAGSVAEAIEALSREPVTAVVSDVRMPGGTGLDLLRRLKSAGRAAPIVVFVSAYSDLPIDETYAAGAEGLVGKPFDRRELVDLVERQLDPPSLRWDPARPGALASADADLEVRRRYSGYDEVSARGDFRLGRGGFFIRKESNLPCPGERVAFHLEFPVDDLGTLEGTGWVRWSREPGCPKGLPGGYAVEISTISAPGRERLAVWLARHGDAAFLPRF